jgi:hypothetical protein
MPDSVRFEPTVCLTKTEIFAACQALADADRVLVGAGRLDEATALGDLFELFEERLTTGPVAQDNSHLPSSSETRQPVHSAGASGVNSMDREFTQ